MAVRPHILVFPLLATMIIFICYNFVSIAQVPFPVEADCFHYKSDKKYLVETSKCRIADEDPFGEDVRGFFKPVQPIDCSNQKPLLSYIERDVQDGGRLKLKINESAFNSYSMFSITCWYQEITRRDENTINHSNFMPIKSEEVNVIGSGVDTISVLCQDIFHRNVYENVHAIFQVPKIAMTTSARGYSIILIGIDSMSRLNLIRSMPQSYRFLTNYQFIPLKGYTKVGDNTFPNLMAILTGRNISSVLEACDPKRHFMDTCHLIWDDFKAAGYVTAYAEDSSDMGTFTYTRKGFNHPPTDFYLRPYVIASEELKQMKMGGMIYCAGPESVGERVMNVARQFAETVSDRRKFGLFWMNSFSHDDLNLPSSMDDKFSAFLSEMYSIVGHDTIIVAFSDHGFRFGRFRYTHTGWLEERQPYFYVHIPDGFKTAHPKSYANFLENSQNRLTTPLDVHATLRQLLNISAGYAYRNWTRCDHCLSLFDEIPENRTCQDAGIAQHWCLCNGHSYVNVRMQIVQKIAHFLVSFVNSLVRSFHEGFRCFEFDLNRVISAGMSENYKNDQGHDVRYYLLIIETTPKAVFEATLEVRSNANGLNQSTFRLLGEVSRIDRYGRKSKCVHDSILGKYCYCANLVTFVTSAVMQAVLPTSFT